MQLALTTTTSILNSKRVAVANEGEGMRSSEATPTTTLFWFLLGPARNSLNSNDQSTSLTCVIFQYSIILKAIIGKNI